MNTFGNIVSKVRNCSLEVISPFYHNVFKDRLKPDVASMFFGIKRFTRWPWDCQINKIDTLCTFITWKWRILPSHALSKGCLINLQDELGWRALTLAWTTNFRLFHTKSLLTTILNRWKKWKYFQEGWKRCGKRRNCSLRAISPFHTAFSKDLYCRHVKTMACLGNCLRGIDIRRAEIYIHVYVATIFNPCEPFLTSLTDLGQYFL